jgi:hypothetical protein
MYQVKYYVKTGYALEREECLWIRKNAVPEKNADPEKTAGSIRILTTKGRNVEAVRIAGRGKIEGNHK